MRIGVVFPQREIGDDPAVIRDFAQTAEGLGYHHLLAFDHVLGAGRASRPDWRGPYDSEDAFHEPFVLFGHLAGLTARIELVTGVLVLPQRQTALVAKQAAEVDVLSGGRLRLGVGVGWNRVEYEALGEDFHDRGRRIEEQIALLRALWAEPVVDFTGRWHRVPDAGIKPRPVQRPVPIWLGGLADPVLRRVAAMGDGWFPQMPPGEQAREALDRLRGYVTGAGRDPAAIGVEARVGVQQGEPRDWPAMIDGWRELGATHLAVNPMDLGLSGAGHVRAIERWHRELVA
ncbi:MAG TPA: LLM class F420-dependent oxidoreductase [Pseudonocardia sp.]|nr:LLM class F420-dependent oxidoreductase [Pseudonocardia sp.]